MGEFIDGLRRYLIETLIRSGKSVFERDFRDSLQWTGDEFRDDDILDQIDTNIEAAAKEHANRIIQKLIESGFRNETDVIQRKDELTKIVSQMIEEFNREIGEGVST